MLLYVDAFCGAAGDMLLGALLDAGLPEAPLRQALAALPVSGYELSVRREKRKGLAATRVEVRLDPSVKQHGRHLSDIEAILGGADLPGRSAEWARRVFRRLAEAEAKVHGTSVEKVHFHEVGAVDAIVDIVGTCAGLALLGVDTVWASPIPTGSGTIDAAHGRLPVPAPAVAELLRGVPIRASEETGELTTPTGAAILVALAEGFGPMPAMVTEAIGYGAGSREGDRMPNVLRVLIGRPVEETGGGEADTVWLLEANLDDTTGEALGAATRALFEAGALDVWLTPATMKKGRPGVVLSCLAEPDRVALLEEAIFRETTTFGIRRRPVLRTKLQREHVRVETPFGPVRLKVGRRAGRVVTASPEYEDCLRQAEAHGVAFRQVYEAALAARGADPEQPGGQAAGETT